MTKITRNDVARLAGVSTATVSRVFNRPDSVSSDKVRRVREAAEKLGYTPNKFASALRRASSGAILFMEPKPSASSRTSEDRIYQWHNAEILRAAKNVIDESMYHLELYTFTDLKTLKKRLDTEPPAGILTYHISDRKVYREFIKREIPYVISFREYDPSFNISYIDEVYGGRIAGEHLLETGHRKFAHITGALQKNNTCDLRWQGFKKATDNPFLINGYLGIRGGYESGIKLIPRIRSGKTDSLFVVNDLTAIGVIQAFKENGIRIPEDISIIGYDNLPFIDTLPFRLTTVDICVGPAYTAAAEKLLRSIQTGEKIHERILPVLVKGESVRTS